MGATSRKGWGLVAFRYVDGRLTELGAAPSEAWGINCRGQIVGASLGWAVLWQPAGTQDQFNAVDLGPGIARAVNERGQVVGSSDGIFLWTPTTPNGANGASTPARGAR